MPPNPESYQSIGWLLVSLGALMLFVERGVTFVRLLRGNPANEELNGGADVLNQRVRSLEEEARESMNRRRLMHEKIDVMEKRLREDMKHDSNQLHEKVNSVGREVASLMAKTDLQNQQLARIETNVREIARQGRA